MIHKRFTRANILTVIADSYRTCFFFLNFISRTGFHEIDSYMQSDQHVYFLLRDK